MDVTGTPTGQSATVTVSSTAMGPPSAVWPTTPNACNSFKVLCQVLSNSVFVTLHDAGATPTFNDFTFYSGDMFVAEPANNLRLIRNGTDACVKFQVFA